MIQVQIQSNPISTQDRSVGLEEPINQNKDEHKFDSSSIENFEEINILDTSFSKSELRDSQFIVESIENTRIRCIENIYDFDKRQWDIIQKIKENESLKKINNLQREINELK